MNLDDNFAKKFGLLKKACVLYSYDRYNDAFKTVADAAVIVQKEKELEKELIQRLEKKWRFKLGLDPAFDLPMPREELLGERIDEKFLKKIEIPGIKPQTLKLYIENTMPERTA